MKKDHKLQTLDKVCNQPAGSFQQHLAKKDKFLRDQELERAERIRATPEAQAKQMSWAA